MIIPVVYVQSTISISRGIFFKWKKKRIPRRLTAMAAAFALLLCAVSCSGEKEEETSSAPLINRAEDGTYFDNGELFCRGVWAADDGEKRQGYYIFTIPKAADMTKRSTV